MNDFAFDNATRYRFGKRQLGSLTEELAGRKVVMLVYGGASLVETGLHERIVKLVAEAGARIVQFGGVTGNPTWAMVEEAASLAVEEHVDFILGAGGGAVMDCAKAIALAARQDRAWKRHWVRAEPVIVDPIDVGFVVTCAGSGSEGNGRSLILNEKTHVKAAAEAPELRARFAILEPELTFTVPREQTAASAYIALSNLMELYFSLPMGGIIADDLIESAMANVMESLEAALENPKDYDARANLMWASALANNGMLKCGKDGIFQCRAIAQQMSAYSGCAYGEALAAIQPQYYRFVKVTSFFMTYQLKRFATRIWGVDAQGKSDIDVAIEGIDAFQAWTDRVGVGRSVSDLGISKELIAKIGASTRICDMKYCKLTAEDIEILLEQRL